MSIQQINQGPHDHLAHKVHSVVPNNYINPGSHLRKTRRQVAEETLSKYGDIDWENEKCGYLPCPGKHLHTSSGAHKDCRVMIDGVPTIHCVHQSCSSDVAEATRILRDDFTAYGSFGFMQEANPSFTIKRKVKDADRLTEFGETQLHTILRSTQGELGKLTASSPVTIPSAMEDQFAAFMNVLPPDSHIWIGNIGNTGQPDDARYFHLPSNWIRYDGHRRPFICPTDFKVGSFSRSLENVNRRIHMVVEFDRLDPEVDRKLSAHEELTEADKFRNKEASAAVIAWLQGKLGLHLVAVIDSGNKSLHAHFKYPGDEIFEELKVLLGAFKCDPAALRAAQPVRTPGYQEAGRIQSLLYLDDGPERSVAQLPSALLPALPFERASMLGRPNHGVNSIPFDSVPSFTGSNTGAAWTVDFSGLNLEVLASTGHVSFTLNPGLNSFNSLTGGFTAAGATGVNSFNSLPFRAQRRTDRYPDPIGGAAFHGLAGQIVGMIAPHTEADSGALLITLLSYYGSMIGRGAYFIADGAKHHMNLYAAIVGKSSKARKGTSLSQIRGIIEKIDPDFVRDNCPSGLSSGEGLISVVRDEVVEMRPAKGGLPPYEEVVAKGVRDKRVLIRETEFASALKVMKREGNSLSPVLRNAWDGLDLRIMTKNSPIKSTEPHISILGHITKEELLKQMNEVEIANGFANRFLYLAAQRSQTLPYGGNIKSVNFSQVCSQLKQSIAFGAHVGEIVRSPQTNVIWGRDYISLSADHSGMFGAVTGRAEAQVTRLSAIYALLDNSSEIRPEHHAAAMAVWKYCEDSVKWIFGRGSGNKTADKILESLEMVSPSGLSRTSIHTEVLNKNISAFDLSKALETLMDTGLVVCREDVAPNGKRTEVWHLASDTNSTN